MSQDMEKAGNHSADLFTNPDQGDRSVTESTSWADTVDWWKSPAMAYTKGLQDGMEMERKRRADEDETLWRAAVKQALLTMDQADRRGMFDRGELVTS